MNFGCGWLVGGAAEDEAEGPFVQGIGMDRSEEEEMAQRLVQIQTNKWIGREPQELGVACLSCSGQRNTYAGPGKKDKGERRTYASQGEKEGIQMGTLHGRERNSRWRRSWSALAAKDHGLIGLFQTTKSLPQVVLGIAHLISSRKKACSCQERPITNAPSLLKSMRRSIQVSNPPEPCIPPNHPHPRAPF